MCAGKILLPFKFNTHYSESTIVGFGSATVFTFVNNLAIILYSAKILEAETSKNDIVFGLRLDALKEIYAKDHGPNFPVITPVSGGISFVFKSDGSFDMNHGGYGFLHTAIAEGWHICRIENGREGDGKIYTDGTWFSSAYPLNTYISGICYGIVS